MKKMNLLIIILALFLSACTLYHIDSQDASDEFYPSKTSGEEIIYQEKVNQAHKVIGTVTVNAERRQYLNEVINRMKREAAMLGGDALTNLRSDATGTWKKLPAQEMIGNGYVRANFMADVIIFTK